MEVAGEMEVDLIHRQDLCVPTAAGATFLSEAGPERGLTQCHDGFLAYAVQTQCQPYRHGSLTDTCLCRRDGGDQDEMMLLDAFLVNGFQ